MEEVAQPWITKSSDTQVKSMLSEAEKRRAIAAKKNHYKVIATLMSGQEADITLSPEIFGLMNREQLELEEYMKLYPQDIEDAMYAANERRLADTKDYNSQSEAKWRCKGFLPLCVATLFKEVYPDDVDRAKAGERFFNSFPKFRISASRI